MSRYFKDDFQEKLDAEIARVQNEMKNMNVTDDKYPKMLVYLERLQELKRKERREPVSRNTWALIGGNAFVTLMVLVWEHKHVITSRAFPNVIRPRVND